MKRSISDLLDGVYEDGIGLERSAPLSARRIREKTMKNIGTKKTVRFRWLARVAVVAAAIMALTLTVFAADAVFGEGKLVTKLFGKELSEGQMELVEDIGRDFTEAYTSNGTTVTPIMGIADEDFYFLHLRVEAPEGVVLPDLDGEEGYYYDFQPNWDQYADFNQYLYAQRMKIEYHWEENHDQWFAMDCDHTVKTLADDDPTDNVKEFVIRFRNGSDVSIFNGPWEKRLSFHGLYVRKQFNGTYCEKVLDGDFIFEIHIDDENREATKLVIDAEDLTFRNEEYGYTTVLHEIKITPLAITLDCTCTEANNKYIFGRGGPIELVMKDGTVIEAMEAYYDASAHKYPHPDSVVGIAYEACFDLPIVVSDIDYLLINGEHIIDVN